MLAHAAGAELADLELCQFHPTALALPGDHDGALITEAVRGEGARLPMRTASGSPTSSHRATRWRRRSSTGCEADRTDRFGSTCAGSTPSASRTCSRPLRAGGLAPEAAPVPVAPAAHYLIGGIADRPRRALHPPRPVRRRRVRLHRAARGEPARVQLLSESFVFGARQRGRRSSRPASGAGAAGVPLQPPTVATRAPSGGARGRAATKRRSSELVADPYALAALIVHGGPRAARVTGPHRRSDHPLPRPEFDGVHLVIEPGGAIRGESWA